MALQTAQDQNIFHGRSKRAGGIPEGRWLNQKIFGCDSSVYINGVFEHGKGYLHILFVLVEIVVLNHIVKAIE